MTEVLRFLLQRLAEFATFLRCLWEVLILSWRASPGALQMALDYQYPALLAFSVALLAGIAQLAGNSVILLFQRIRPGRFAAGLILNGILYFLYLVVDGLALWLVASLATRSEMPIQPLIMIACLGSAPLMFDLLAAAGTLGPHYERLFRAWSWLIALLLLRDNLQSSLWVALLCLGLARLLVWLLRIMLGAPLNAMSDGLWHLVTGVPGRMSVEGPGLRAGDIERSTALRLSRAINVKLQKASELQGAWQDEVTWEPSHAGTQAVYGEEVPAQLGAQLAE